jgi:tyrosine-protein kinase Etk/Wzc
MNESLLRATRSAPVHYEHPGAPGPAFVAPPTPYREYFAIVRRHKFFIALVTCLCALAGHVYLQLAPKVYQASMLVQVEENPAPAERLLGETANAQDLRAATATELEVLRSRMVVSSAVDRLRLFIEVRPRYLPLIGQWLAARHEGLSAPVGGYVWGDESATVPQFEVPPALMGRPFTLTAGTGQTYVLASDDAALRLAGRVGVAQRWASAGGEIALTVSALHARPGARFTLRRFARLASIENLQQNLLIAEQGKQSGVIGVRLEGSDPERLARILKEIGRQYISQNEERRAVGAGKALAFLDQQLPALKQSMEAAELRYNRMRKQLGSIDLGEEAKGLLERAGAAHIKLMELTQKQTELAGRYANDHPMMVTVNEQLDALNRDSAILGARIKRLPQVEQEIVRLGRDMKVSTEVYTAALSNAQQLQLSAAKRVGNVRLLDGVETPVIPAGPRPHLVVGAAALLGLLLATLAACVHKRWQGRVDEPYEVEQQLGLAVLAAIPHSARQRRLSARLAGKTPSPGPALLQLAMPDDDAVESLRRLRALLQRALAEADKPIVVIAGPGAGVGKSFVAANLAALLASAGTRVLLVDADLRGGRLHRVLAAERGPGLAEYLAGHCPAQQIVRAAVLPHLDLIPAGELPLEPAELLAQDRLRQLLRSAMPEYDCVVVDTAPVLSVSDALSIAALGAVTLNVARSGVTTIAEIEEATRQLRQAGARMAGVIVNGLRSRPSRKRYRARAGRRAPAA